MPIWLAIPLYTLVGLVVLGHLVAIVWLFWEQHEWDKLSAWDKAVGISPRQRRELDRIADQWREYYRHNPEARERELAEIRMRQERLMARGWSVSPMAGEWEGED